MMVLQKRSKGWTSRGWSQSVLEVGRSRASFYTVPWSVADNRGYYYRDPGVLDRTITISIVCLARRSDAQLSRGLWPARQCMSSLVLFGRSFMERNKTKMTG